MTLGQHTPAENGGELVASGSSQPGPAGNAGADEANSAESARFSQSDLDKIIAGKVAAHSRALDRARADAVKSARSAIASELGIEESELDGLRERLSQGKQSESDAVERRIRALEKSAQELSVQRDEAIAKVKSWQVREAIVSAARDQRACDPDVVHDLLRAGVDCDHDGNVTGTDGTSVGDMVANLLKSKPYLVARQGAGSRPPDPNVASRNGHGDLSTRSGRTKALREILGG